MIISGIKRKIKTDLRRLQENKEIRMSRRREIKKFQDPRRVAIYSRVCLSDSQMAEIDKVYKNNYGEAIPYTWHRHFMAFTGRFDPLYFPEYLFIPEFERFMNPDKCYTRVFGDKAVLPLVAGACGVDVCTPQTIFSCVNGLLRNHENNFISRKQALSLLAERAVFVKPTIGSHSGIGCMIIEGGGDKDKRSGKKLDYIFRQLGKNYIVQECITCHSSIRKIYAQSVNTFRVITYIWHGSIEHMPVIMRIGQGGAYLDNAHAGGMFIAISDDGILHKNAFTEFCKSYSAHPDSGVVFEGYRIEHFSRVLEAAKKMHQAIPQVGCINWDFTINEQGIPVLIEGNMRGGSIWLIEMAHGCGAFGKNTPEVLRWLRLCKKVSPAERDNFAYGFMDENCTDDIPN